MATRITYGMTNDGIQSGLSGNFQKLDHIMNQVSSQKRILAPVDDSVGTWESLRLRSDIGSNQQYQRNVSDADGWLSVSDSALNSGNNLLLRIRELALQAASDTYGPKERNANLLEARQQLEQVVSMANANFNGSYIFSGTQTQVPPFTLQKNATASVAVAAGTTVPLIDQTCQDSKGNYPTAVDLLPGSLSITGLTEGKDYDVDYVAGTLTFRSTPAVAAAGTANVNFDWVRRTDLDISGDINRQVQTGQVLPINVKADQAFGKAGEDVFSAIIAAMKGMLLDDSGMIRDSVDGLDRSRDTFVHAQTVVGSIQNRTEATGEGLASTGLELTKRQSAVEDVDLAQAASELSQRQQVYQASLQVAAKIIQPSLLQFL